MLEKFFIFSQPGNFVNLTGHFFAILYLFFTLVFVSLIIRSKRPPGSTLAWLMFTVLIPYLGIPLYVFLSNRKFKTRLDRKQSLYHPLPHSDVQKPQDLIEKVMSSIGAPPTRGNRQAQLITSGTEAYEKVFAAIDSAKHTIHITTFIFGNDSVGREITKLLVQKACQGVKVRILLDSLGAMWVRHPSFSGLKQQNGEIAHFMPFFHLPFQGRSNLRNHRKILVVDSQKAILGGMNIAKEYMGPEADPQRWTDLCLFVEGSSATDVENIFCKDWKFSTGRRIEIPHVVFDEPDRNHLQILASGPDVVGDPLYDFFLTLIYKANHRVWIASPYFIPDESLAKALELAAKRGVQVKLLTPVRSNHFLADLARGSYLRQLYDSGGEICLTRKMMHAKAILVDDYCSLVGSANFDMRSLLYNYEIGALLRSGGVMTSLEHWFEERFLEARVVKLERGFWIDMAEGVGRVLGPLI